MKNELTAEKLRQLLDYNPSSGVFTWRENRGSTARAGAVAGYTRDDGQTRIQVGGRRHYARALAHLHLHGAWPAPATREKAKPKPKPEKAKPQPKGQKGNHPKGDDWRQLGAVHDVGIQWVVYARSQPPPSEWITIKVAADGRAARKANYWWTIHLPTRRIGYRRARDILAATRPSLAQAVDAIIARITP